jgi:DNA repair protein RecO (recombination protein O)
MQSQLCIVLRAVNYRDYDRILTLFSRAEGRLDAQARGARRVKSALRAAAQPFCCAEYEFYGRGDRLYVTNVLIREEFYGIQNDYAL